MLRNAKCLLVVLALQGLSVFARGNSDGGDIDEALLFRREGDWLKFKVCTCVCGNCPNAAHSVCLLMFELHQKTPHTCHTCACAGVGFRRSALWRRAPSRSKVEHLSRTPAPPRSTGRPRCPQWYIRHVQNACVTVCTCLCEKERASERASERAKTLMHTHTYK